MTVEYENTQREVESVYINKLPKESSMLSFLIKKNIVKDKAAASKLLLSVSIIFFILSLAIFFFSGRNRTTYPLHHIDSYDGVITNTQIQ